MFNTAEQEGVSKKQKEIKLGTIVENKEISTGNHTLNELREINL
jgi:hypothetical protein